MEPRIAVLTIGVDDLERSLAFYRDGLGLPTAGIVGREFEHGAVAFFDLQPGVKLAIFPRDDLALDAGLARTPRSATEFSAEVQVKALEPNKRILVAWSAYGTPIDIEWVFTARPDGTTFVSVTNSGFRGSPHEIAKLAVDDRRIPDDNELAATGRRTGRAELASACRVA